MTAVNVAPTESVRLVVLTAPGADRLPWDPDQCSHPAGVRCSGLLGCRCDRTAVEMWEESQYVSGRRSNWGRLHRRVLGMVRRAGLGGSPMLAYVDEDQARGVVHRNVIVRDTPGGRLYQQQLARLATGYGFGFADRATVAMDGKRAANYLAGYLTKSGKKGAATATATAVRTGRSKDPQCRRRRTIHVSASVTTRSRCTMTSLANGRRLWAHRAGHLAAAPTGVAVVDWRALDLDTGEVLHNVWAWDLPPPERALWAQVKAGLTDSLGTSRNM